VHGRAPGWDAGVAVARRASTASAPPTVVVRPAPAPAVPAPKPVAPAKPQVVVDAGLPAPMKHALRYSNVVVAAVYLPGSARDAQTLREARAGARDAHAGFVALNVGKERIAAALAPKLDPVADPAVLVFERPGTVVTQLDGYADRTTVAQAAANAR
jgi:hypothetical protein